MSSLQADNERLESELNEAKCQLEKSVNERSLQSDASKMNFEQMSRLCEASTRDVKMWSEKSDHLRTLLDSRQTEIENLTLRLKGKCIIYNQ